MLTINGLNNFSPVAHHTKNDFLGSKCGRKTAIFVFKSRHKRSLKIVLVPPSGRAGYGPDTHVRTSMCLPEQSGTMSFGRHSPSVSAHTYSPSVGAVRGTSYAELQSSWQYSPCVHVSQAKAPLAGGSTLKSGQLTTENHNFITLSHKACFNYGTTNYVGNTVWSNLLAFCWLDPSVDGQIM